MAGVRVAVVEEHEIFRLGLAAALREDPSITLASASAKGPVPEDVAAAVVSLPAATDQRFPCPLVNVTAGAVTAPPASPNRVFAMLPRGRITASQLTATVRAAAAGLRVVQEAHGGGAGRSLDARSLAVLRLLAGGADTTEISRSLRYSPHTIKSCIYTIERTLGARNRTQAVAESIRQGII